MRALFAVIGFVLFYAVTIAAVVGLGWVALHLFMLVDDIHNGRVMAAIALVASGALLAAGVLAWSALPRIDRFEPPGPELSPTTHPELFAMIREVAAATHQRMPEHVYAVLAVNAFVTERGGFMGLGSRRVMGIGMGLLNAFTVDEVRAVIAHEFGHFHGGDTRLGPWVYKTRAAMGRAVVNLQRTLQGVSESSILAVTFVIVERPYRWMALGYLRLAAAVSRAQEYSADAVAARAVGTGPVLSGFKKLAGTAAGFDAYLDREVSTLVDHGVLPPVLSGARRFLDANRDRIAKIDADQARLGEVGPFDSHPPLPERIAAVERLASRVPERVGTKDDRFAIELVTSPERLVRELVCAQVGRDLDSIEWDEVAPLFVRQLHYMLARHRAWLVDRSVRDLGRSTETLRQLVRKLDGVGDHVNWLDLDKLRLLGTQLYTAALSVALEHLGYEPRTGPGEPVRFAQADEVIDPAAIVRAYLAGELSEEAWLATWEGAGLPERPWADVQFQTAPARA